MRARHAEGPVELGAEPAGIAPDDDVPESRTVPTTAMQRARGRAAIALDDDGGWGRLARLHQSGCLKLRLPRVPPGTPREAVLINTAGGLTGGDRLTIEGTVGDGARLMLATQTAERLYRSTGGEARVAVALSVGDGAALAWLPQETIAFEGSALRRTLDVDLAPDARFLAVEPLALGRLAMGERLERASIRDDWRVRVGGRSVHAEALRLGPDIGAWTKRAAALGGRAAMASVLYVGLDAADHVAPARDMLGPDGAADAFADAPRLIARLVAPDTLTLRRRLVPLLAHLNGAAMGLGCGVDGQRTMLPAVWSM